MRKEEEAEEKEIKPSSNKFVEFVFFLINLLVSLISPRFSARPMIAELI